MEAIAAPVTLQTTGILYFDGDPRFMGEADNPVRPEWIGDMFRARTMACFAPFCFQIIAGILQKYLCVDGVSPVIGNITVATGTKRRAQIFFSCHSFLKILRLCCRRRKHH